MSGQPVMSPHSLNLLNPSPSPTSQQFRHHQTQQQHPYILHHNQYQNQQQSQQPNLQQPPSELTHDYYHHHQANKPLPSLLTPTQSSCPPLTLPPHSQAEPQSALSPVPSLQPGSSLTYPAALATHDEVCSNRDLFFDTLNKFHASLGTRLMIPTIGGKELDLHLLYVEVTSRGGLEQVIKERKWKEVTLPFNFPPTTTSASFVLRKYYISLLHHYAQVYYVRSTGQLLPPPATLSTPTSGYQSAENGSSKLDTEAMEEPVVVKKRKRKVGIDPNQLSGVDPGTFVGHSVSGVIDGKFEHGYLVTANLGADTLTGVLYHIPSGSLPPQFASVSGSKNDTAPDLDPVTRQKRRRRRKEEMPKKDPNAPKPNRSGYNFFFQEQHLRLKALHPDKDKEISKMIGELWNNLTEEEKAVYQDWGSKDKERYQREMAEYWDGMKASQGKSIEDLPILNPSEVNWDCRVGNSDQISAYGGEASHPTSRLQGNHLSGIIVELGDPTRQEVKTEDRNFREPSNFQGAYG